MDNLKGVQPPVDLYERSSRGILLLERVARPEFELPMHWLIVEYVPGPIRFQLKAPRFGLWTRSEATERCLLGLPSLRVAGARAAGIVGRGLVDIFDADGRLIWWRLLAGEMRDTASLVLRSNRPNKPEQGMAPTL